MNSREEIHGSFVRRFSIPRPVPAASVSDADLHRVEKELRITFPSSYFAFITQYGPVFTPDVLGLVTGGDSEQVPEGASFDVREFFDPDAIIETHRLYASAGMADWLAPIAMDSMGDVFGFTRNEQHPRPDDCAVHFFDHEFCKIYQEADSFDTWLGSFLRLAKPDR